MLEGSKAEKGGIQPLPPAKTTSDAKLRIVSWKEGAFLSNSTPEAIQLALGSEVTFLRAQRGACLPVSGEMGEGGQGPCHLWTLLLPPCKPEPPAIELEKFPNTQHNLGTVLPVSADVGAVKALGSKEFITLEV